MSWKAGGKRSGRRDTLPHGLAFGPCLAAIDNVAGKVGVGHGLPAQVDCVSSDVFAGGSYSGQAGGHFGRKDVQSLDAHRGGELAGKFLSLAVNRYTGHTLGAVLIGLAEADIFVQSSTAAHASLLRA